MSAALTPVVVGNRVEILSLASLVQCNAFDYNTEHEQFRNERFSILFAGEADDPK